MSTTEIGDAINNYIGCQDITDIILSCAGLPHRKYEEQYRLVLKEFRTAIIRSHYMKCPENNISHGGYTQSYIKNVVLFPFHLRRYWLGRHWADRYGYFSIFGGNYYYSDECPTSILVALDVYPELWGTYGLKKYY